MPLDENWKKEILDNIKRYGSTDISTAISIPVIANNLTLGSLINRSSGIPRFNTAAVKKFYPIIQMPEEFVRIDMHPAQIRCCLCDRIINYPCWYHVERYDRTQLHFFVCSSVRDGLKDDKVSTRCLRVTGKRIA